MLGFIRNVTDCLKWPPVCPASLNPCWLQNDFAVPPTQRWSLFSHLLNLGWAGELLWTREWNRNGFLGLPYPNLLSLLETHYHAKKTRLSHCTERGHMEKDPERWETIWRMKTHGWALSHSSSDQHCIEHRWADPSEPCPNSKPSWSWITWWLC